jgi:hypothetical protein
VLERRAVPPELREHSTQVEEGVRRAVHVLLRQARLGALRLELTPLPGTREI